MDEVKIEKDEVRLCDFCEAKDLNIDAHFDAKTQMGYWADMCHRCFNNYGIGLGLGKGQKLIRDI